LTSLLYGFKSVIILSFILIYLLFPNNSIDYGKEITNLISCNSYSEEYLDFYGYTGPNKRKDCENLNFAFHNEALDKCSDTIGYGLDINGKDYERLLERCVYHQMAGSVGIMKSVSYIEYKNQ
jgi:hypothetical protein